MQLNVLDDLQTKVLILEARLRVVDTEQARVSRATGRILARAVHNFRDSPPMDVSAIWGGTFHHIGNRILRRHARLINYEQDFTILDREDQKDLLDACLTDAKIDTRAERFPKGDVLAEIYSLVTNTGRSLERVLAEQYDYFSHLVEQIRKVQSRYAERKREAKKQRDREARYRSLFEDSPTAVWEEDFSAIKAEFDALRSGGIADIGEWLRQNPEEVRRLAGLI
ncbi:MAG: UvrD-helicase domain-containing protein, partial [Planctomycetota bacterium]